MNYLIQLSLLILGMTMVSSPMVADHDSYPGPPTTDKSPYFRNNLIRLVDDNTASEQVGFEEVYHSGLGEYVLKVKGSFTLKDGASLDNIGTDFPTSFVGMIAPFAVTDGDSLPDGWLECDGTDVSKSTYAALFAKVGTTWGTATDSFSNFRLPDLQGFFTRAVDEYGNTTYPTRDDDTRKTNSDFTGADKVGVGSYQNASLENHGHTITYLDAGGGRVIDSASVANSSHAHTMNAFSLSTIYYLLTGNPGGNFAGLRVTRFSSNYTASHTHTLTMNGSVGITGTLIGNMMPDAASVIWGIRYE